MKHMLFIAALCVIAHPALAGAHPTITGERGFASALAIGLIALCAIPLLIALSFAGAKIIRLSRR